ncbi:MAG: hypothetical protein GAK31_01720 [Stenotrophomonas maltophilia]|uniref:Uncharacterized protein n=1 Tax=Stenotrophomonas maltophilia TaxID=40324 RepID=A0A7V8FIA1_STEMA|nr:MAG: hypothetical protein GAK31_01720 [Stenotrophomonas maltophilia]
MTTGQNPAAPAVREPYDAMGPTDAPNPPTARATLATAQPGGRVRLGHHHGGEQAAELGGNALPPLPDFGINTANHASARIRGFTTEQMQDYARAAQPTPAGQGDALADAARRVISDIDSGDYHGEISEATYAALEATLAARQPVAEQHPDDLAVDAFAAAMKAKMATARAKGRDGWDDPAQCSADDLTRMLRDHVEKGDPRDVANFCMMLHQRGEAISARLSEGQEPVGYLFTDDPAVYAMPGSGFHSGAEPPANAINVVPLYAAPPTQAVALSPFPMDTAPTDGTLVRLLVDFTRNATDDSAGPTWTIGANNDSNVMTDERMGWRFAGWCWTHDHFTEGEDTPVGWLPLVGPAAQAVDLGQPDPTLLRFYQVTGYPALVEALEEHVLKLIDLRKRSVKPWEDTMPPTLLPKWIRENSPVLAKDLLTLADKWQDEAAATWGESPAHAAKQQCCDELRALTEANLDRVPADLAVAA